MFLLTVQTCTHPGPVRTNNEDLTLWDAGLATLAIADGMGGHNAGEVASRLAVDSARAFLQTTAVEDTLDWPFGYEATASLARNRLRTAFMLANREVFRTSQERPECAGMGTTVAAILLSEGNVVIGNVGDSRVYLLRCNELKQISFDDTFVNTVARQAGANAEEMANHPMRNVLTQAAGSQDTLDVHIVEQPIESGDLYLICSDGLHGVIGNASIRSILGAGEYLERAAVRMRDAARAQGGPDNISVILMSYNL